MTSCANALKAWSEKNGGAAPEEAEEVKLLCMIPPITKMDNSLNSLAAAKKLSLSTNSIDKMISLPGLKNLEILSLGRNQIKKIQGLEEVGATLKELWISYNHIQTLDGLHPCTKLQALFMSNNKIKDWDEYTKLTQNPALINILTNNNPCYGGCSRKEAMREIMPRVPTLKTIDGELAGAADTGGPFGDIKEVLEGKGGIDAALGGLGQDMNAGLGKDQFVSLVSSLGVDGGMAGDAYDELGDGASLAKLADACKEA